MWRATAVLLFVIVGICIIGICIIGSAQSKSQTPAPKTGTCEETARTQLEINQCSALQARKAQDELDELYKQLLARASSSSHRKKVEAAQKAWIAYRDAELEAKYPAQNKRVQYGSVYPMCVANDRAEMIKHRIEEIRALLEEGDDVCAGEWARQKQN